MVNRKKPRPEYSERGLFAIVTIDTTSGDSGFLPAVLHAAVNVLRVLVAAPASAQFTDD